ncbi:MAG: methyltransferase domain-containing protein [Candidatus Muirbacterium halophilum]|nr:methyltransferase domain-containing protein [Candidatus Muirbacterium halophilum]MCK9475940.1 methyltransferase domain-containing protein [Candidatus Muirbacterium halophilum]
MSLQFKLESFGEKHYLLSQSEDYKFTIDSIALGYFIELDYVKSVIDLGCSTGILEFVIESRKPGLEIYGIEIQPVLANIAEENFKKNNLSNISVLKGDYVKDKFLNDKKKFDIVMSNPPYMKMNSGVLPDKQSEKIAKFELNMDMESLFSTANSYLNNKGKFVFTHKASRISEIFMNSQKFKMGVERIQFVHSNESSKAYIVIVECSKRKNIDTKVEKPLIIYENNGKYKGVFGELFK